MAESGGGEEEEWEYYDDNKDLPDFWQVRSPLIIGVYFKFIT